VRTVEVVRSSQTVKTVNYTSETVEEGTSLKKLEKLTNFGASTARAANFTNPKTARYAETTRMKPRSSLSNGGVNKYKYFIINLISIEFLKKLIILKFYQACSQ